MAVLTEENVRELLVEGSMNKAVFVYFYMTGPECDATTTALTNAISNDNAYVSLVLADVAQPIGQGLAMQLGFEGVPALAVFKQGRPVEVLQGSEVLEKLTATLQNYMPKESELKMRQALEKEAVGQLNEALTLAAAAYAEDNSLENKFILARLYLKNKNLSKAHELLDNPGRQEQESQEYKDLISQLTLAEKALQSPELQKLQQDHAQNPQDVKTSISLAIALSDAGKRAEALEILFEHLKQDLSLEDVKKTFLDILSTLSGDPLQKQYRQRLYTLMY